MSEVKKPSKKGLRLFEVVQQLEYMTMSKEEIVTLLNNKSAINDWAFIVHDKDVNEEGQPVKPHYHICCRMSSDRKFEHIAKWFNVPVQCVEPVKSRWKNMLQYLIHENAPNKYQYSIDEVEANFDFEKGKEEGLSRKEEIIQAIENGDIREYNITDKITAVEYDKYKRNIENAFTYRQKKLLKEKNRMMECVFITGASGSGKTTYAKRLCEKKGFEYFVSGSSNDPFDGYQGEDAIILDDLRGSVFTFADLLKITDNHTNTQVKSRYRNKLMECKLLIITSVMDIDNFYSTVFESSDEPLIQFERRMQTYVKMDKESMIIHYFDKDEQCYMEAWNGLNPVSKMHLKEKEVHERLSFIEDLFGDDLLDDGMGKNVVFEELRTKNETA